MATTPFALDDDLPMETWLRRRAAQLEGGFDGSGDEAPAALSDDMPMAQWQRIRGGQARGLPPGPSGDARPQMVAEVAARSPSTATAVAGRGGPLSGRPGIAAVVADALNAIASGPNTAAPLDIERFHGTLHRGPGRDFDAEGRYGWYPIGARGTLDPPTGRPEVGASGLKGRGVGLPSRVRVYNTPTGELDIELPGAVTLGPFSRPPGTYVIGQPDPPARR